MADMLCFFYLVDARSGLVNSKIVCGPFHRSRIAGVRRGVWALGGTTVGYPLYYRRDYD